MGKPGRSPVGAGVDDVWGGDACVALACCQGDASVPTPHPHRSRPYGTPPSFLVYPVLFSSLDAYWALARAPQNC
jgi:hypothetical protein